MLWSGLGMGEPPKFTNGLCYAPPRIFPGVFVIACRSCGRDHSPLVRCEIAASIANAVTVANGSGEIANKVVGEIYPRYRNKEARREYMRKLMKEKRRAMKYAG